MAKKDQKEHLSTKKLDNSAGGLLSQLWAKMLFELSIGHERYDQLMERYIRRASIQPTRHQLAAQRMSLVKELFSERITFKTLLKGIRFLGVPKFDLIIRLHHPNGKQTSHMLRVDQDEITYEDSDETSE